MRRTNRMVLGLVAVFVLGSSLALFGCGGGDDDHIVDINQANAASLVGGKAFTFPVDSGFGVANAVLAFNSSAGVFALSAGRSKATGTVVYGSCIFIVGPTTDPDSVLRGSNFARGLGPQPNDRFTVDSCQFDTDINALILNGVSSTITQETGTGGFGG